MLKVKSGEIARLGLLFERHHKSLFGFLVRISGDPDLSEDMVQNVFEKILKNRKQFKGFGKFSTWMFSIARNEWIDHIKKSNNRSHQKPSEEMLIDTRFTSAQMEEEKQDKLMVLEKAFTRLADEDKQLLALTKYEGLSYRDAGSVLNISEGNARIRAYRAMHNLRTHFFEIEKQLTP